MFEPNDLINRYMVENDEDFDLLDEDYNEALKYAIECRTDEVYFIDDSLELYSIEVKTGVASNYGPLKTKEGVHEGIYLDQYNITISLD